MNTDFMRIITTHSNSDFDAVASVVAAMFLYPGSRGVIPRHVQHNVRAFLAIHRDLFHLYSPKEINMDEVDSLVVTDTNSWRRLEGMNALKKREGLEIHLWDHHMGVGDIPAQWQRVEGVGAVTSLLVLEMKARDLAFAPMHATLFLMGIFDDTGHLAFPSTRPEDAAAVAYLLENGADLNVAGAYLAPSFDSRHKEALTHMLETARVVELGGFKVGVGFQPVESGMTMLSEVVEQYKEISGVDAAFGLFTVDSDKCMVIGRGQFAGFNVGSVVRGLGGGGHPGAGSAMVKGTPADQVYGKIMDLVTKADTADVPVTKIMSRPRVQVDVKTPMAEVLGAMEKERAKAALVMDGEKVAGVLSLTECRKVKSEAQKHSPAKAFMKTDFQTLGPDQGVREAVLLMMENDAALLPIVENKVLMGVVTRGDVMLHLYHF